MDIGLCHLTSPIRYASHSYFQANPPRQLVTTHFFDQNIPTASWFEADDMSCGRASLRYIGPAIGYPDPPPYLEEAHILQPWTFTYFGPDAVGMRPGLCGASVVHEKSDDEECDGAVVGFVCSNEGRDCVVATLDELVEYG